MSHYFRFGECSTLDFDIHIEKLPTIMGPTRKRTTVPVAGRNGDLHYDEDAFSNYSQTYECYFHGKFPTAEQTHAIREWLTASGGYLRLEDTYDPSHFRMASFVGPLDVDNYFNKYGRCKINFDCAPQSFLKSGESPVLMEQIGVIHNPTGKVSLPLIKVICYGSGGLTIGNKHVEIKSMGGAFYLDCETENAYSFANGAMVNQNKYIHAVYFPRLSPGANEVTWYGGVVNIEIIPRWWEI